MIWFYSEKCQTYLGSSNISKVKSRSGPLVEYSKVGDNGVTVLVLKIVVSSILKAMSFVIIVISLAMNHLNEPLHTARLP